MSYRTLAEMVLARTDEEKEAAQQAHDLDVLTRQSEAE